MKELLPWILLLALTASWLIGLPAAPSTAADAAAPGRVADASGEVFDLADLRARLAASGQSYLPFLGAPTLRASLYAWPAGGEDRQRPHDRDEVYYVTAGRATLTIDGEDHPVQPGSVVFLAADVAHRFHVITEDLELLVFFSEAVPDRP